MAARTTSLPRPRALPLPSLRALARPPAHPRRVLLAAGLVALAIVGWMWLRDSSLVAAEHIEVTGATGPQAAAIEAAVRNAGRDMTTLHVRRDALRTAVAPFPIVRDVEVDAKPLHTLRVRVVQYRPVALLVVDGRKVPVAGDGTLLRGAAATGVPVLPLRRPPVGDHLTDRRQLAMVRLLAAAPAPLRAQVAKVFLGPEGLTARLRAGVALHFGDGSRLAAKWAAATAVLADASSHGATALDLRVPERPAAAGLEQAATQEPAAEGAPDTAATPLTASPQTTQTTPQPGQSTTTP